MNWFWDFFHEWIWWGESHTRTLPPGPALPAPLVWTGRTNMDLTWG